MRSVGCTSRIPCAVKIYEKSAAIGFHMLQFSRILDLRQDSMQLEFALEKSWKWMWHRI